MANKVTLNGSPVETRTEAELQAEIVEMTLAGMSWCDLNEHWVEGVVDGGLCEGCYWAIKDAEDEQRYEQELEDEEAEKEQQALEKLNGRRP